MKINGKEVIPVLDSRKTILRYKDTGEPVSPDELDEKERACITMELANNPPSEIIFDKGIRK